MYVKSSKPTEYNFVGSQMCANLSIIVNVQYKNTDLA
jgi:hypothetical protein